VRPLARGGSLPVDFAAPRFTTALPLLGRSFAVFFQNLPFLAAVTLAVMIPVKFAAQYVCSELGYPPGGAVAYFIMDITDLIFGALVTPAAVYGLMEKFRAGQTAPLGDCFRWGFRQWGRTFWNGLKVEITIILYGALLIVPGVIAMIRLIFVNVIVAIEGDHEPDPLQRSRDLAEGRRWKIFAAFVPVMILDLLAYLVLFSFLDKAGLSWASIAAADCALSVGAQWALVVTLSMYLGVVEPQLPAVRKDEPAQRSRRKQK